MADGEGLKAPLISREYGYIPIDPDVRDRCHQDEDDEISNSTTYSGHSSTSNSAEIGRISGVFECKHRRSGDVLGACRGGSVLDP